MIYPIAIDRGNDTEAYGVIVPDIQGCFSAGDTLEEALQAVEEAITGHLSVLADDNEPIPLGTSIDNHLNNPDYHGMIWAIVDIDINAFLGKAEKINVTLPSKLVHMIDLRVSKDPQYTSRSGFLAASAQAMLSH